MKFRINSINTQIAFAFFALTALIVGLDILANIWIRQLLNTNSLKESSAQLKEMQMQMKSASNEFILREKSNEKFFESGKSIYLLRYNSYLNQLKSKIVEIEDQLIDLNTTDEFEFESLKASVHSYDKVFQLMAEKIKVRGYGRYGLIGEFDKSINDLLKYDFGKDNLAVINLQLFVKEYLLTGNENAIDNISNEIFNFTMALEKHIRDEDVEKVSSILLNYETIFKQLTEVDKELGIYTGGGLQKSLFSAIDDLDKTTDLENINKKISEAYSNYLFRLYVIFFLVIGAAIIAALIINRRLNRILVMPIMEMRSIIMRMGRGEVPETKMSFKVDELNEMANAINTLVVGSRNYQDFANNIGKGNLNTNFTPLSSEDILGNSLLSMRESLSKSAEEDKIRVWAAQGLAEMNDLLRSHSEIESELYNKLLQFVIRYTKSNQGGIFLLDEEAGNLELIACYAWDKKKFLQKTINIGQGVAGQCALEKEVIYLTNLPDDYIKITSGLGESNPSSLLVLPIKVEDRILGVLEIASFKKFQKHEIDLVKKFSDSLASAVHFQQTKRDNKSLLEKAQQQSKEVKSRQDQFGQDLKNLVFN
jgi:putative methionine-R-sulfoxide reductase with GAF domain